MLAEILAIFLAHKGKILCGLGGFFLGWLLITRGLAATLLLCICVLLGYLIGKNIDEEGEWGEALKRLLSFRR